MKSETIKENKPQEFLQHRAAMGRRHACRQSVWERMTPLQRLVAQSKDRDDAARRAAKNHKRAYGV